MTSRQSLKERNTQNILSPSGRHWYPLYKASHSANSSSEVSVRNTTSKYSGVPAFN